MKTWNYLVIFIGIAFLFEIVGISIAGEALSNFGITTNGFDASQIDARFIALVTGISVAVIFAGTLTSGRPENYVILPAVAQCLVIFTIMGNIINAVSPGWARVVVIGLIAPLGVGFGLALLEWFRGTD